MKRGDLVCYRATGKRFYVVLREKKFPTRFKPRIQVVSDVSTLKYCFLEEDLEILNEK